MRGETVIVREFGDEPLMRKVWGATADKVYICDEETYRRLLLRKPPRFTHDCFPVGFPREDVFEYSERAYRNLTEHYKRDPSVWNHLKVWRGDEKQDKDPQAHELTA